MSDQPTPRELALIEALSAACGYMRNAAIDLATGAPKRTALMTIEGGIRRAEAVLAANRPEPSEDTNADPS